MTTKLKKQFQIFLLAAIQFLPVQLIGFAKAETIDTPNAKTQKVLNLTELKNTELTKLSIERRLLGSMNLPSGGIVAIDPISKLNLEDNFIQKVRPGFYPVSVYQSRSAGNGTRNALAEIRFSTEKVVKWELATTRLQPAGSWHPGSDYGFQVESATGAFISPEGIGALDETEKRMLKVKPESGSLFSEYLRPILEAGSPAAFIFKFPSNEALNMAVFETGDSDGIYSSYLGYDQSNKPIVLVASFLIIEQSLP